jgi:hypothetical protein
MFFTSRACVCAAGRVQSTITLDYKGDLTYGIGPAYLWAVAECTCVIMVFCVPVFPQVFRSSSLLMSIFSSIKSWTGSKDHSSRALSAKNGDRSWGSEGAARAPHSPLNTYERMADGDSKNDISLTTMERAITRDQTTKPPLQGNKKNSRILRTVEWTTGECPSTEVASSTLSTEQHPWVR